MLISFIIPFLDYKYVGICRDTILSSKLINLSTELVWINNSGKNYPLFGDKKIVNKTNIGFSSSCNQGASIASGKYLVFFNSDFWISPEWLSNTINYMEKNKDIGIGGPVGKLFNFNVCKITSIPKNITRRVDYVVGACLVITKKLFNSLGGFDTNLDPAFFEDVDISFSAKKLGFSPTQIYGGETKHNYGVSVRREGNSLYWNGKVVDLNIITSRNMEYFKNKWKNWQ